MIVATVPTWLLSFGSAGLAGQRARAHSACNSKLVYSAGNERTRQLSLLVHSQGFLANLAFDFGLAFVFVRAVILVICKL